MTHNYRTSTITVYPAPLKNSTHLSSLGVRDFHLLQVPAGAPAAAVMPDDDLVQVAQVRPLQLKLISLPQEERGEGALKI